MDNMEFPMSSGLLIAAVQLNEVFNTLQEAGFTHDEALFLVGKLFTEVPPTRGDINEE